MRIKLAESIADAYLVNLEETRQNRLDIKDHEISFDIGGKKIISLEVAGSNITEEW